jgi:hypothetical protein
VAANSAAKTWGGRGGRPTAVVVVLAGEGAMQLEGLSDDDIQTQGAAGAPVPGR